ncbi:Arginine/ornithine antiporter ArcD [Rhodovulum sp. P5]|uniref:ceramidase domain-containing protein n=1 Tax=Rhodovulum sp. P5 TaxID=1564506 RepID=UPI0009C279A1|nr:ceramidase domain-containing protein [Rhodovulum sp. P5]ARE38840.1 Arginine/ornithine antiporter ArcD [Rhodovulum sp. P5]
MNWTEQIDAYCERTDPTYWSEPINAVTNAAFVIAALVMWPRAKGQPLARALCIVLAVIGVGSFLFHTHATAWASMADVLPILAFILLYLFAANRHYWGLPLWPALGLTALFFPYAAVTTPVFTAMPWLGSSAAYAPVALLILLYAALLARRLPNVAWGLGLGGGLLVLSLTFRTLDGPLCPSLPVGTHFMWHILNAVMLAWMIEVYLRAVRSA